MIKYANVIKSSERCCLQKALIKNIHINHKRINLPTSKLTNNNTTHQTGYRFISSNNNKLYNPKKTILSEATASKSDTKPVNKDNETSKIVQDDLSNKPEEIKNNDEAIIMTNEKKGEEEKLTDTEAMSEDDFLTTIFENMEPYMDTYEIYKRLIESDFTPEQADEVINLIIFQLNSKLSKLSIKYSQLYELENERYLYESAQQELRVDITRSRENHINELINLINILERDYHIIADELNNHLIQMKNDTQVAMSDQKSENTLLSKKIILRIQETNHKLTTELNSAMRSEIESLRWHYSRWGVMAILVSIFSVFVSYYIWRARIARRQIEKDEFVPLIIYEPSEYDEDDYHTDLDRSLIN